MEYRYKYKIQKQIYNTETNIAHRNNYRTILEHHSCLEENGSFQQEKPEIL